MLDVNKFNELITFLCDNKSSEMEDECDGTYVGAEDVSEVEFEGKFYKLIVTAFWEKSRWYEYTVNGVGFDFTYSGVSA